MKVKLTSLALTIMLACAVTPLVARAQAANDTWTLVKLVPVGDTLTVKLKSGRTLDGEMEQATDTTLSLQRMGRLDEFQREEIQKVYRRLPEDSDRPGPTGLTSAILGGTLGLAAFGVLNAGDSGRSHSEQRRYTTLTAMLVPAGAAVGFFAERAIKKVQSKDLIYEAK